MRGGLERWKRGVSSHGVRQALAYAFEGSCDSHLRTSSGVDALAGYSAVDALGVTRFTVESGVIRSDELEQVGLQRWVDGRDPLTGERRGRDLSSPEADLILDGTINAPKSFSIAAMVNEDLGMEFEALQDRLRDRILLLWQTELNARRGAGGRFRESLRQIEVVELRHARSRALDPHIHRHLWLNVKVLGQDGKWSNVDSRVAMKMHTLINAEGELAARTDPDWIAALARHGYTLDADGEIAEFAHAVRPLSRRSNQIERNRAVLLARWRDNNPGAVPSPDVLQQIDRRAWATGRPNKPGIVDETAWAELVRDELTAIDAQIGDLRAPAAVQTRRVESVDPDLLAAQAVVDADTRSTACGGRFSRFDIRAGAVRAVAASGVVGAREDLQPIVEEVVHRAMRLTTDLLPEVEDRPEHVKGFMASSTAALKVQLAARFDALTRAGVAAELAVIDSVGQQILDPEVTMADRQREAAAAIAGTDRLVSVTGPAGAGKTTMLRVANTVLALSGRRMVVVAPTKKAASVAGREIGTRASSLHALLADHGWRWGHDQAGSETWHQLQPGETDPATGFAYAGPRSFPLAPGDRVVVDESGMVDLHTANALAAVAEQTGAGVAMVGDHLQAMPVGHRGAMAIMTRRSTAIVELTTVHRFLAPGYADLTLRMRDPHSREAAVAVAAELEARGLIRRVENQAEARDAMVEAYFRSATDHRRVALVTGTNEEADAINEAIQQRRLDGGQVRSDRIAVGQGEQRLLEGDVVQTRRNDRHADVENRAVWTIRSITVAGIELVSVADSTDVRSVSHDYAADHLHLAYASTVHGIQGETTHASIVGPGVDASGLYVGMTRGRARNEAIAIAHTASAARNAIADSMLRGLPEVSVDDSIRAAHAEFGRAAQSPPRGGSSSIASWSDRSRRPWGRVIDLGRLTATLFAQSVDVAERLARAEEWLRKAERAVLDLDASTAAAAASHHGRTDTGGSNDRTELLRARHQQRTAEHPTLLHEAEELQRQRDGLETERILRATMTPSLREAEDAGRRRQGATSSSSSIAQPTIGVRR
jgi:energy-coupling factor transporter ATP-binding protein EcfA2